MGLEKHIGYTPTEMKHEERRKTREFYELNEKELGDITRPRRFEWKKDLQVRPTLKDYNEMLQAAQSEQDKKQIEHLRFINKDYGDEQMTAMQLAHKNIFSLSANISALEPYEQILSKIRKDISEEIVKKLVRDTGYSLPGNRKK